MVYLDNASTTMVFPEYIEVIKHDLTYNWGNPSNLYRIGQEAKKILEESRERIANTLYCEPDEIFFTSGASEGNSWALHQRKRCVTSAFEHHNLINHPDAIIIGEDYLESALRNKDKMFIGDWKNFIYSHMYVNNETGEIFGIEKFANIAHALDMPFASDMTQAIGKLEINFQKMDFVDIAVFSGHKLHAPRRIGFNYFNKKYFDNSDNYYHAIQPFIHGGGQELGKRHGTEDVAYAHVLSLAVEDSVKMRVLLESRSKELKKYLIEKLAKTGIDYIIVSPANSINSTFAFCIKGVESEMIMDMLSEKEIYIGVGSGCNGINKKFENDTVLTAMQIPEEYVHGLIRVSFSISSNKNEINEFVKELVNCCNELGLLDVPVSEV